VKKNVISVQVLALDSDTEDGRSTLEALAGDSFIAAHAALLHTSASHTAAAPRARVIFVLSEALEVGEAELALRALQARYPYVDSSTKDACRVFYGAQACEYKLLDNVLDVEVLRSELIRPYQALQVTKQTPRIRHDRTQKANAGAAARYVAGAKTRILEGVARAPEGTGERHAELRDAAVRLASLAAASWLTEDARACLEDWEGELIDAARVSGYLHAYGEEDVRHQIDSGLELATPAVEPDWKNFQDFFQPGDNVAVMRDGRELVNGRIERMRQARAGHWEALIVGVWYPRAWLRHDATNSHAARAGQAPQSTKEASAPSLPEAPQTAVEGEIRENNSPKKRDANTPPPPDNFTEDWDSYLPAADFFAMTHDGRGRNIYAGLVRGEALEVEVPEGAYLTEDALSYDKLPRHAALNANTGLGKTSYALDIPGQKIIATSSTLALEQILERRPEAHAYYHERKDAAPDSQLIVTTYESFQNLLKIVDASRFWLVVDEAHNFAASSSKAFRGHALNSVMDTQNGAWRGVTIMTGTPVPLSHPYLRKFTHVNVASQVRTQHAQRIVFKSKEGKGKRLDSLLELCTPGQKHLIYLNDKGVKRDKLVAGLVARGFEREQIALLDSDTKNESAGRAIVEQERLPEGVRVLIVTHVAVEALNLQDTFDCVHIVSSNMHPYIAQQLVNRLRTAAAGCVYWYNASDGGGYSVDTHAFQAHHLRDARSLAKGLNGRERVNLNDTSQEAILARSSMRRWETLAGALVREDEDIEDGRKWWDINYLGADNAAFHDIATYTNSNPRAWQNELKRYGWSWLEDRHVVIAKTDTAVAARQKAYSDEMKAERTKAHQARVATMREHGDAWTRDAAKTHEDVQVLQVAQQVVAVQDSLKASDARRQEAFLKACELVEGANDNTRKLNAIKRQIKAQHLALAGDAFTLELLKAFTPGERLTSDEVHQRVMEVYTSDEVMTLHARHVLRYHFSAEAESRLTARKAVEVLGDLYTVKRSSARVPGSEAPVHVYEIVGEHEAHEIVATLVTDSNKTRIVATNAPPATALAFETSEEVPAVILDWSAGEIPATAEEVASYQAWKRERVSS
jgi:hypothetical protein